MSDRAFSCAMPSAVPPRPVCNAQCAHCRLVEAQRLVAAAAKPPAQKLAPVGAPGFGTARR